MRAKKLFDATDDLTNSRRFIAALIILQTKAPVHYSVLLATELIWTHAIPTAATDGIYVYCNPDFFRGLASDDQRAFLLAHEVSHNSAAPSAWQGVSRPWLFPRQREL